MAMRRYGTHTICFISSLLLIVATGCSDPEKTGANPGLTPPTVTSVAPLSGASGCVYQHHRHRQLQQGDEPGNHQCQYLHLDGPTGTVAPGVVNYSSNSRTAILTPSGSLAPNTLYTATISTGARDVFGNALASSLVCFTTGVTTCSGIGTPAMLAAFRATAAPRP